MDNQNEDELTETARLINELLEDCCNVGDEDDDTDIEEHAVYQPTPDGNNNNGDDNEAEDFQIGASSVEGGGLIGENGGNDDDDNGNTTKYRIPKLTQWNEVDIYDNDIILTVGKARRRLWHQCKKEVMILKKNISNLSLPQVDTSRSDIYKIYQYLFGPNSILCETFCRHLTGLTKQDYLRFLITYFSSCQSQMSLGIMYYSRAIDTSDFMEHETYNLLWARISALTGSRRQNAFWIILEETANKLFKSLFMDDDENNFPSYLLGIDDDKLHYNYGKNSALNGLKPTHHVKDNKKGFTLHTAAFSATCVPVTVCFQRDQESVQDTYIRIIKILFGSGAEAPPNLRGVTLASDRGYWKPSLVFEYMLEWGAQVQGTVQRVSQAVVMCDLIYCF